MKNITITYTPGRDEYKLQMLVDIVKFGLDPHDIFLPEFFEPSVPDNDDGIPEGYVGKAPKKRPEPDTEEPREGEISKTQSKIEKLIDDGWFDKGRLPDEVRKKIDEHHVIGLLKGLKKGGYLEMDCGYKYIATNKK